MEEEIVYGEDLMRLAYGTHVGLRLSGKAFLQRWLSRLGGLYFDSGWSRRKIRPFVERLGIDLSETSKALHEYRSFNEFFARNLKQGRRPIDPDLESLISPADGRLLVFPRLEEDTLAHVKWAPVHLMELFNRERSLVKRYSNGACGVLRLAPPDYHRFHFPVAGTVGITTTVPGFLHSVSPYALEKRIPVFALNKRTICQISSANFGQVLLLEIGAFGVGEICQTHQAYTLVERGQEKGYFKFGGSSIIFFLEPGRLSYD